MSFFINLWAWFGYIVNEISGDDEWRNAPLRRRIWSVCFAAFLIVLFFILGVCEWAKDKMIGSRLPYPRTVRCTKCKNEFDTMKLTYPLSEHFCKQCAAVVGLEGMTLIGRFFSWAGPYAVRSDFVFILDEFLLCIYNSLVQRIPRAKLILVLERFTKDRELHDPLGLAELLEDYDKFIGGRL